MRQLVAKGVLVDGVKDVFGTLGLNKPDLSLLDEQFLAQIQKLPTKNLAAELLERLIADQVKARGQKNAMQAKEFTDKLEEAIAKYQNRALTTVEVIEELIKLAKEINAAKPPEGLTEEEFAFYQALPGGSAPAVMQKRGARQRSPRPTLLQRAQETDTTQLTSSSACRRVDATP